MITAEEMLKQIEEINKANERLSNDFNEYLGKVKEWHKKIIEDVIKKDEIEKYIGIVYEMALFYSFIFDKKIILNNYFNADNAVVLHRLYAEIAQNILWVYWSLIFWNVLWAICLCRTILERVITLKIIFEDSSNKTQIEERIEKYKNIWWVLSYKFAEEVNDQEMMTEYQTHFNTYSWQYQNWKYFEYTQSIYWKKRSISELLRDFGMDNWENHLYWILSITNHWSIVSNNLLDVKNGLLPCPDKDWYKRVAWLVITIMTLSIEDLVKYINNEWINPVTTFLQWLVINWNKN